MPKSNFLHANISLLPRLTRPSQKARTLRSLPPSLPLLLPRRLAIPKREPARPLIRPRRLAHPARILRKQQSPNAKAEKQSVAHQPSRKSKAPAPNKLRVKVESRDSLESDGDGGGGLADVVLCCLPCPAGRGGGVFAAAGAVFGGAGGGTGGGGGVGCCLGAYGDYAGEDEV